MTPPAPTDLTVIGGQAWRNKGARALAAVHLVDCLGNGVYFGTFALYLPAEARHLREKHLRLPERGWGSLLLVGSTPDAGRSWTDSGEPNEDRQLRHRAQNETRLVPAAPELVETLRRHLGQFPSGAGAKRPYDLRHAAVSLWLNAGVPATQGAQWAASMRTLAASSCP